MVDKVRRHKVTRLKKAILSSREKIRANKVRASVEADSSFITIAEEDVEDEQL